MAAAWMLLTQVGAGLAAEPSEGKLLWQIGKADNDTREFALGPNGYREFKEDPVFLPGVSNPRKDWPYVHPGPADAWAGGREHTFSIAFGLKAAPTGGQCRLVLDLVDTQGLVPPRLRISMNGHAVERAMPRGGGDESVSGDPKQGKEHRVTVAFPASRLHAGTNEISITTRTGSWVLYDWLGLEAPEGLELAPAKGTVVRSVRSDPALVEREGKLQQAVQVSLLHLGGAGEAEVQIGTLKPIKLQLRAGSNIVDAAVPAVQKDTPITVTVRAAGKMLARRKLTLKPVRKWVVYLLPHSHVDIGYTHLQTDVERSHWQFYEQAIEASRKTADYPPGAQFKWNVEVLWATDSYLKQATPEKRKAFIEAIRKGWIGLDALYGNELTALCSQEELVRLTDFAGRLSSRYGLTINTAMISDVPGYTWGIVPVLAQRGVKYFSIGPNGGHRIGYTLSEWGDKPFWWLSPCGRRKVLVWIPRTGYWRGFQGEAQLMSYLRRLEGTDYPFDLLQVRHCLGDNAGPGVQLSEFAKKWNTRYTYPKVKIATTSEMFADFARRYGEKLPEFRGDFTPYWEDGAGSSALETGLNRAAAERLVQAETLWALLRPGTFPDKDFYAAWRNVILYDEHTWGAHNSISQPDSDFAKAQWKIKQAFALDADKQSRKLLAAALGQRTAAKAASAVDVFNTTSWPRTDLVIVSKGLSEAGDAVRDAAGQAVPSQRLKTGELAFLAADVPPLGAARFTLAAGKAGAKGDAHADGAALGNGIVTLRLDEKTGAIASLTCRGIGGELVDRSKGLGLNDYFYVAGRNPKDPNRCGPVRIRVGEAGPLVASLIVTSDAPGCRKLTRTIRVASGLNRVDVLNVVDKEKIRKQEGVHFAFPLNVPKGVMRMDTPWAVVRPETDQLPGACKNYLTIQRWVDVSNKQYGLTWATVDAPLIEIGEITSDPRGFKGGWIRTLKPSTTLYSYVMNNYWETNYKADQEGPTTFRYSLRPHGPLDLAAAQRFGVERRQPLIAAAATGKAPPVLGLRVRPEGVLVTALKPSQDGKALIVRLFNASGKPQSAELDWARAPKAVCLSDLGEKAGEKLTGPIEMAPNDFVTLRVVPAPRETSK